MAQVPEPSGSRGLEEAAADADAPGGADQSLQIALEAEESSPRSDEFDALVEDIRRWYGWDCGVLPYVEDQTRRRLGLAPLSAAAAVFAGLLGVGIRLALALLATALLGEWAGIPWGRWTVVLTFYALHDASRPFIGPPIDVPSGPSVRRIIEGWTPLLPNIVEESDL